MDGTADPPSHARVLLLDDDQNTLELMQLLLERHAFEVRIVDNVRDAFALVREQCPDVAVTDLEMPGLDGFDFRSVMSRFAPSVPIIAVTGTCDAQLLTRAHDIGFWRVLFKPCSEAVIVDAVAKAHRVALRAGRLAPRARRV